jgi:hypothetical protein
VKAAVRVGRAEVEAHYSPSRWDLDLNLNKTYHLHTRSFVMDVQLLEVQRHLSAAPSTTVTSKSPFVWNYLVKCLLYSKDVAQILEIKHVYFQIHEKAHCSVCCHWPTLQ